MEPIKRRLDFVFCLDATGSMGPWIEAMKRIVNEFFETFAFNVNTARHMELEAMRIKFIFFKDYMTEGKEAIEETNFMEYPVDKHLIISSLDNVIASGGGDIPENGLEALHFACESDWFDRKEDRQIIFLISDADYVNLFDRAVWSTDYPLNMSKDIEQLLHKFTYDKKTGGEAKNRRLILVVPEGSNYTELDFPRTLICPFKEKWSEENSPYNFLKNIFEKMFY